MEKISKKISIENHKKYIDEMALFGWNVSNLRKEDDYAYIELTRDPGMENYQRLCELEKKFNSYNYPPLWPMILFSVLAFGLITALLVVFMINKGQEGFNGMLWFLYLGLPAFGCITLSTIWFAFRVNKMKKVLNTMDKEIPLIKAEAKTLLGKENEK